MAFGTGKQPFRVFCGGKRRAQRAESRAGRGERRSWEAEKRKKRGSVLRVACCVLRELLACPVFFLRNRSRPKRRKYFWGQARETGRKSDLAAANFAVQVYWTLTVQKVCMHSWYLELSSLRSQLIACLCGFACSQGIMEYWAWKIGVIESRKKDFLFFQGLVLIYCARSVHAQLMSNPVPAVWIISIFRCCFNHIFPYQTVEPIDCCTFFQSQ
jgi:hypothetical protein